MGVARGFLIGMDDDIEKEQGDDDDTNRRLLVLAVRAGAEAPAQFGERLHRPRVTGGQPRAAPVLLAGSRPIAHTTLRRRSYCGKSTRSMGMITPLSATRSGLLPLPIPTTGPLISRAL